MKNKSDIKRLKFLQSAIMRKETWVYLCVNLPFGIKHKSYNKGIFDDY